MQKRSQRILELLKGGDILQEARLKALKITTEIQGYGNSILSSPPPSTSPSSSSFGSYSTASSTLNDTSDIISRQLSLSKDGIENYSQGGIQEVKTKTLLQNNEELEGSHLWDCPPIQETGSLLDPEDDEGRQDYGSINGVYSKLVANISPSKECHGEKVAFRSFSDIGRLIKRKYDRQFSMGY